MHSIAPKLYTWEQSGIMNHIFHLAKILIGEKNRTLIKHDMVRLKLFPCLECCQCNQSTDLDLKHTKYDLL